MLQVALITHVSEEAGQEPGLIPHETITAIGQRWIGEVPDYTTRSKHVKGLGNLPFILKPDGEL